MTTLVATHISKRHHRRKVNCGSLGNPFFVLLRYVYGSPLKRGFKRSSGEALFRGLNKMVSTPDGWFNPALSRGADLIGRAPADETMRTGESVSVCGF